MMRRMDILADILRQAGLQRRLLDLRPLQHAAALRFPCDKSIGFHVVTQGQAFVHAPGLAAPLALHAGDVALMARGCHHVVSSAAVLPAGAIPIAAMAASAPPDTPATTADDNDDPAHARVLSGAYQFWNTPVHPFFASLPDWTVVRADSLPRLGPLAMTVALLGSEAGQPDMGSEVVLHGLMDVAFTYLLRQIVAQAAPAGRGWLQAVRSPQIRRVVELMHADSARAWTLETLARSVGLSRTALAQQFRAAMDDTPLNHLRAVRMQKAMHLLSSTDGTLDAVAAEVGYQDAFSFSKVFKRTVGLAPRDFRRRDAAERGAAWRL